MPYKVFSSLATMLLMLSQLMKDARGSPTCDNLYATSDLIWFDLTQKELVHS